MTCYLCFEWLRIGCLLVVVFSLLRLSIELVCFGFVLFVLVFGFDLCSYGFAGAGLVGLLLIVLLRFCLGIGCVLDFRCCCLLLWV